MRLIRLLGGLRRFLSDITLSGKPSWEVSVRDKNGFVLELLNTTPDGATLEVRGRIAAAHVLLLQGATVTWKRKGWFAPEFLRVIVDHESRHVIQRIVRTLDLTCEWDDVLLHMDGKALAEWHDNMHMSAHAVFLGPQVDKGDLLAWQERGLIEAYEWFEPD